MSTAIPNDPAAPAVTPWPTWLGTVLCRLVIPAWILFGAFFKLKASAPSLLPKEILKDAHAMGINFDVLLMTFIAIELVIAATAIFVHRLARPLCLLTLAVFVAVLIREIAAGNGSCGCLGANSPSPWVMLGIDSALLLGALFLKTRPWRMPLARWPLAAAALASIGGIIVSTTVLPKKANTATPQAVTPTTPTPDVAPTAPPDALPSFWFASDIDTTWPGRAWSDIDLLGWVAAPLALDSGTHYVVFYSRTCEHCEAMFRDDFAADPALAAQVIAVEVPASSTQQTDPAGWRMPQTDVTHAALPVGPDWIMTTPVALRIVEGTIECAEEGDHRRCLGLPVEDE